MIPPTVPPSIPPAGTEQSIDVLNGLIEKTLDSALGYKDAAEEATNDSFKTLFATRARQRRQLTTALQAEVISLGGQPETDGTVLGAARRMFVNLKNAVTGSDQSVVSAVEAGEDDIKSSFEKALQGDLPMPAREVVATCYDSIKADHDQMSTLKHALEHR
ncbi:PA2169 family four-helix-bundle protein [Azospirillum sp. B4]|uniref:ferritin-like domain-containing protein n=1 Tax=Azospirillum sp. B4 TaxID=95605 RepID=UPI000348C20D|nr:PA2169 family four-helix-bundle protein [Azospirillum sp. B4]